jgi:elongation factor P
MYKDEEGFHFMDNANYEQTFINGEVLGDQAGFMQENITVEVMFFNGKAIGAELPIFGTFTVVKTDPGFKGDTVQGGTKPATLDTGAVIQVPLFVVEGDILKVDTRDGNYIERVGRR